MADSRIKELGIECMPKDAYTELAQNPAERMCDIGRYLNPGSIHLQRFDVQNSLQQVWRRY